MVILFYNKIMYWFSIVGLMLIIPNINNTTQHRVCCASKGTTQLTVLSWVAVALQLQPVEVACFCVVLLYLEESLCAHDLEGKPRAS